MQWPNATQNDREPHACDLRVLDILKHSPHFFFKSSTLSIIQTNLAPCLGLNTDFKSNISFDAFC